MKSFNHTLYLFEHIKRKENVLVDSLLRFKHLGLYKNNGPEKVRYGNARSIFNTDAEALCNVDISQNINKEFEIEGIKYHLDEKDLDDIPSQSADTYFGDCKSLSFKSYLDLTKLRKLQQQNVHISQIVAKCKAKKYDKILYYLDEHGIVYSKIKHRPNIFYAVIASQTLQPHILYETHNALRHNGSTRL